MKTLLMGSLMTLAFSATAFAVPLATPASAGAATHRSGTTADVPPSVPPHGTTIVSHDVPPSVPPHGSLQ
jgi:hypothetical protein